jgi:hypothetical protein
MGEEGLTPRERHGMGQMGEFYQLLFIIKEKKKKDYHQKHYHESLNFGKHKGIRRGDD